ncbi:hypothetical protein E3N88_13166 [Mikania micrantha]|uniref:Uncharacterized protein n=1 Tax=Mikania micrantha TaxID=192012 RepID=A0A5N6PA44_9ASTR|nr:hypothetical protein E3N88_13166 [Mikania micrantha]
MTSSDGDSFSWDYFYPPLTEEPPLQPLTEEAALLPPPPPPPMLQTPTRRISQAQTAGNLRESIMDSEVVPPSPRRKGVHRWPPAQTIRQHRPRSRLHMPHRPHSADPMHIRHLQTPVKDNQIKCPATAKASISKDKANQTSKQEKWHPTIVFKIHNKK